MGMAASQARLLTITARLADNELRSQTINNAKMRLAAQSSQASETYINALNNATFKFSNYDLNGNAMSQDLTYNALTAYSSYNTQYGLINSANQILVSEGEAAKFIQANGNLNTYLKSHGLEFKTTYFEELGAIQNEAYPEPFNIISVERLEQYHREYGSYENSMEVQDFENSYTEYVEATNELIKGGQTVMLEYLKSADFNANDITTNEDGDLIFPISSIDNYKAIFTNNTNNYNLNQLRNNGILPQEAYDVLMEEIDAYSYSNGRPVYSEGVDLSYTQDDDGNRTYTLDEGIVIGTNADGIVTSFNGQALLDEFYEEEEDEDGSTQVTSSANIISSNLNDDDTLKNTNVSIADFINSLSYAYTYETTNADGDTSDVTENYYYNYKEDAAGNVTTTLERRFANNTELLAQLQASARDIIDGIVASANYENFADFLINLKASNTPQANAFFTNLPERLPGVNKSLDELLDNFQESKEIFLNTIFDTNTANIVSEHLKAGNIYIIDSETGDKRYVSFETLTDIDFVLQYLKGYYTNDGNEATDDVYTSGAGTMQQSNKFNTVIKEFLLSEIIATNGEPKYAWVDENDTANTGNADAKAQWYTNLFNRMNQGFKILENGLASSKEWMEYALESGIVTLEQVDKSFRWNGIDYRTCTRITEETDDSAVTKAEAEYNRAMKDIEAKDNIYDLELKNIDTEHTALQTEYDVIKGVIDKNIARTFKFNQSA